MSEQGKNIQRVSEKDAEIILQNLIKNFKNPTQNATAYTEDYAGASSLFINEDVVKELIKKLTR